MWRAWHLEILLVPQVHARLVADLDRGGQVAEDPVPGLDDRVLGFPGQVGAVKVGQVVVENARLRRLPGYHVPYRLAQAPGGQVPLRQVKSGRPGKHLRQRRVAHHRGPQVRHLLVDGQPADAHGTGPISAARGRPAAAEAAGRPLSATAGNGWIRLPVHSWTVTLATADAATKSVTTAGRRSMRSGSAACRD